MRIFSELFGKTTIVSASDKWTHDYFDLTGAESVVCQISVFHESASDLVWSGCWCSDCVLAEDWTPNRRRATEFPLVLVCLEKSAIDCESMHETRRVQRDFHEVVRPATHVPRLGPSNSLIGPNKVGCLLHFTPRPFFVVTDLSQPTQERQPWKIEVCPHLLTSKWSDLPRHSASVGLLAHSASGEQCFWFSTLYTLCS